MRTMIIAPFHLFLLKKYMAENPGHFDPRQYLAPARTAIQGMVEHKIKNVLGCDNKA